MGFLTDLRSGERGFFGDGALVLVFFAMAGALLGGCAGLLFPDDPKDPSVAREVIVVVGGVLGVGVGLFVAFCLISFASGLETRAKVSDEAQSDLEHHEAPKP